MIKLQGKVKKIQTNDKGYSYALIDTGDAYPERLSFRKDEKLPKVGDELNLEVGVFANYWDKENKKMLPANKTFYTKQK